MQTTIIQRLDPQSSLPEETSIMEESDYPEEFISSTDWDITIPVCTI